MPLENLQIIEVSPRDGFQDLPSFIPTEQKIEYINLLSECNFYAIEPTAFVSEKNIPNLSDSEIVYQNIDKTPYTRYDVLIPNMKGMELATTLEVNSISLFMAASETFSQKNTNCNIENSLKRFVEIIRKARFQNCFVRTYLSCVFACPFEGKIKEDLVLKYCEALYKLGIDEISLGDTIGAGTPELAHNLLSKIINIIPKEKIALHFHDNNNMAIQNIAACLELGVNKIDSSLTGMGGCPNAPETSGNVATEKVIAYANEHQINTNIDEVKLQQALEFTKNFK